MSNPNDRSGKPAVEQNQSRPRQVDSNQAASNADNTKQANANQGEGDRSADRRYREATERFVSSQRGHEAMRDAGKLSPQEQRDVEQAEQQAKQRAKEHDPAERLDPRKPAP